MKRWLLIALMLIMPACIGCSSSPRVTDPPADWANMSKITPRGYACARATSPIVIDGKDDDSAWAAAPWTEDFVDIQGDIRPAPRFRTRAKMLWDDKNLYIYAELTEPHVWGTLKQKNAIMYNDNDFEIFINPNGNNHNYYEFEMNALNTIWELTLDKPYRDGGPAHLGDNIPGLKSAVHIDGTLNNPADTDRGWSVELAIPWAGLARYADLRNCPPKAGEQWRMNFSRVEWLVDIIDGKYHKIPKTMRDEDNWVWSPQGVINMHCPERWGYVQFCDSAQGVVVKPDPSLPARDTLMEIYYRQRDFKKSAGHYAKSLAELGTTSSSVTLEPTADGYIATCTYRVADGSAQTLHVRQDSKLF